ECKLLQFKDLGLDNRLLKNLAHQNIKKPTEIQRKAVPVAMAGKDILASSKTGSGKTLAFVLPMLHKSLKSKSFSKNDPRAVILAPTRELAKQVYTHLRSMLGGLSYDATLITGGENFNDQVNALRKFPKFIVATPGRLADHLEHQSLFLNGLETLILDEADRMLDLGFAEHLQKIHKAANHRRRQTLMFSATLDHDAVASRGLDLTSVTHVINFDMPKHMEEYVHRVGRTGRAGKKGTAISLVGPKDWESFKRIENFLQKELTFSVFEDLKGKFKGLVPKKKRTFVKKDDAKKNTAKRGTHKPKAAKKRDNSFHTNVAVGDQVFMPKKKPKTLVVDDE
ncbi:UNVERIFIED_CONTAM: hypothetical protein GTU68_008196, partial [Idotea baltica]|nr:hypothetical protein [Idotea baltica]